jgi:hypothetical protein
MRDFHAFCVIFTRSGARAVSAAEMFLHANASNLPVPQVPSKVAVPEDGHSP